MAIHSGWQSRDSDPRLLRLEALALEHWAMLSTPPPCRPWQMDVFTCLPAPQPPPPSPPTTPPLCRPASLFKNLFVLKNLLAMPHGTWDLSSLTRD